LDPHDKVGPTSQHWTHMTTNSVTSMTMKPDARARLLAAIVLSCLLRAFPSLIPFFCVAIDLPSLSVAKSDVESN